MEKLLDKNGEKSKFIYWRIKMKKYSIKGIIVLFSAILIFGCVSIPSSKRRYSIIINPAVTNSFVQSAWLSYTAHIRADMDKYYNNNQEGEYIIPFDVELDARNSMLDFYLRVQKDYRINDEYIEDLLKIRASNLLAEYVFFSFNPGNWINENNFQEEKYREWMDNNMPGHIPLTLARVERID